MKYKIIINCLILTAFLGLYGCSQKQIISESVNSSFDQTSNWAILNKSDGVKQGNTYAWDFTLKHPADYVVQVVFDTLSVHSATAKIKFNEQEFQGVYDKKYSTYDHKIVSEFKGLVKVRAKQSKHTLNIDTDVDFY